MSRYYVRNGVHYGTADEMIDLIEELEAKALANRVAIMRLEAKLAKAVEALEGIDGNLTNLQPKIADNLVSKDWLPVFDRYIDLVIGIARTTLAELTGGEDGNSTERR